MHSGVLQTHKTEIIPWHLPSSEGQRVKKMEKKKKKPLKQSKDIELTAECLLLCAM